MKAPADMWGDGYLKAPRSWYPKNHIAAYECSDREAQTDLFFMANHDERNGLPEGACDPSIDFLAVRWKWHKSRVRRFMRRLEREGIIIWQKVEGRRNKVTQFRAYKPPEKGDSLATPRRQSNRHPESLSGQASLMSRRQSSEAVTDTHSEPNRTKSSRSAKREERVPKKIACPECGVVEIDASEDFCSRCDPSYTAAMESWQPGTVEC